MVKAVNLSKELIISLPNKAGILANLSKIISDHGINCDGVAGYVVGNDAKLMLVTDDSLRAKEAMQNSGIKSIVEKEVVVVELENKPGALKVLTARLISENIDIKYIYGTTCTGSCAARIVMETDNNEKAVVVLKG